MERIRLVVFDLGGVIVRHCRTWAEGCVAAGLPTHEGCTGPEASAHRKELARLLTCGMISEVEFYARMSESTGRRYTPAEIERIHHCWTQEEYAGVYGLVDRLRARGSAGIGVLSNTNAAHWRLLSDAGRYPTVNLLLKEPNGGPANGHAHASHLLRLAKPDPAIYAEYQRRAGIAGSEILFLEDLPDNQAAARAAGWNVEPIDWRSETAPQIGSALARYSLL